MALLDGNPKTGFGIVGRAKAPFLILRFARPLHTSAKSTLIVKVHQDSDYRQATIGRFRVGLSSGMYSWDGNPAPKTDAAGTAKQINEEAKAEVKSAAPREEASAQPKEKTDNEGVAETDPSTVAGLPKSLLKALELPEQKRSARQAAQIRDYFEYSSPRLFPARLALAKLEMNQSFLTGAVAEVMITESVEPRVTRVLPRGNWMDDSGQIVQPAIPEFLGRLDTGGRPASRLDLANWLVSTKNPLTARVYRESFVERILRHRNFENAGRSGLAGRVAHASGTARMAGG